MGKKRSGILVWGYRFDLQDESGAVLLLTMMLMIVFALLTVSLFDFLTASTQITGNHRLELRTLGIADAGIEAAVNELRADPYWTAGFSDESFSDGEYTVTVDSNITGSNPAIFREADITSTGELDSFQRAASVHVKITEDSGLGTYSVSTTSWRIMAPPSP